MEHALVTGAAGFIGSHLTAGLLSGGWQVTGLDIRGPASGAAAEENLAGLIGDPGFRLVVADLAAADLQPLLAGVTVVFHLAGVAGVRASWGGRFAGYLTANVLGTQRLLEACAAAGTGRLVLASSSSVYGPGPVPGAPSRESDPVLPLSPYGVSKLAAERLCLAYAARPGAVTSVAALRYFSVYGPRQRPDMALSRIMAAALSGRPVTLYGSGAQRRDFTHVTDAVAATIAAAGADLRAEVINVASGRSVALAQAVQAIEALAGRPVPAVRAHAQPGDPDITAADLTRAREVLGWTPAVDLAAGLASQWDWLAARHARGDLAAAEAAR
jgi:UDP-glucuronate 4-epimerase